MNRLRSTPAGLLLGLCLLAAGATAARAQGDTVWSALYLRDLDSARAVIAADHPGAVDTANPAFARTLASAYEEARRAAARVNGYSAYRVALNRFGNRFQDAHLNIGGTRPLEGVRDAGIYPVFRNGALVAEEVDGRYGAQAAALRGATVQACDGRPASRVFREGVLSWRGRPAIEADWYLWAPLLLVDYGPMAGPAPASCRFRTGGRTVTVPLRWRPATSAEVRGHQQRLTSFAPRPLGVERLEDGRTVWVNVPTFAVDEEREVAAMHTMIDSLRAEMARNHDWRLLVFDLRGNSGGSSTWGDQIAAAVFGEPWAQAADAWLGDGVYTEWRVSPHNLEAVRGGARQAEQRHGVDSPEAMAARAFVDSMEAALRRGVVLYGRPTPRRGAPRPEPVAVPGRIVVVTSASCFSACLDFMDRVRLHPATIQVGETTGVDTDYMENWGRPLPSGLSSIGHPMKVYRNRRRANNQAYAPQVRYEGRLQDTEALRGWILRRFGGRAGAPPGTLEKK